MDPGSEATEAPLAIVCEFGQHVSEATLQQFPRLAWNFSRRPLLITREPTRLRTWSGHEAPPWSGTGDADMPSQEGS
jgi:hypothetical protein